VIDLNHIQRIYFLGAGGIGMSALARYIHRLGKEVAGYDRTCTPLTMELAGEGIPVHYSDDPALIPQSFRDKENTLVVYTPALPGTHAELNYFKKAGFCLMKRAELLGEVSRGRPSVAVAGTHGKTSVSTLLAHLLATTENGCTAFLGGISKNYGNNLIMTGQNPWFVLEADEFDRSFLRLYPAHAVVTSMDADHLDIYGDYRQLQQAFNEFVSHLPPGGILLMKKGLPVEYPEGIRKYTYSVKEDADFTPENRQYRKGKWSFDLKTPGGQISRLMSGNPGKAGLENAVASAAMAWLLGAGMDELKSGLDSFEGVKRRFDFHIRTADVVYMDDYAHHPEELKACIEAVRDSFPGRKITGIFQPHLYTRTRDFATDFARSLDLLDTCILVDIYPAREEPLPGITADTIRQHMRNPEAVIRCRKEDIIPALKPLELEVLLTLGAGDIDTLVTDIKKWLQKRFELL